MKKLIALAVAIFLTITYIPVLTSSTAKIGESEAITDASADFMQYKEKISAIPYGNLPIELPAKEAYIEGNAKLSEDIAVMQTGSSICWEFKVPKECRYLVQVNYLAGKGRGIDILLSMQLNGKYLYPDAKTISLQRIFKNKGDIIRDNNGNDLRPDQSEVFDWQTRLLKDYASFSDSYFEIKLEKNSNTLKLSVLDESIEIKGITLVPPQKYDTYERVKSSYDERDFEVSRDEIIIQQAEEISKKSHSSIYSTSDFGDAGVEPSHPSKIRINTFGKGNWSSNGQWVSWTINVKKAGYYKLTFKYKQDTVRNFAVVRSLTVNGKVPFNEARQLYFDYSNGFKMYTIGDKNKNPYYFYLNEGDNEIALEVVLGYISQVLSDINDITYKLNEIYRKIIMVTGVYPDMTQDYYLDKEIPGLMDTFEWASHRLEQSIQILKSKNGSGGQEVFLLDVKRLLDRLLKKPSEIPGRLENFKQSVSSLASFCNILNKQPLELDYIVASGKNAKLPKAKASFFKAVMFYIQSILASFVEDYNAVGNVYGENSDKKPVKVWMNYTSGISGRDQMNVLKRLIDNDFSVKNNIPVNMSLVNSSLSLTQSMFSNSGPDVVLGIQKGATVNFAMREAVLDLSVFKGFEEVTSWFFDSSFIHYRFKNGVYALPETQIFQMMFYRTDILDSLFLDPPKTWDEFYEDILILQKNKYQIGLLESTALFETLLLQHGGSMYNENLSATNLNTPEALASFTQWTDFYSKYTLPVNFEAYNRFRSGEMPIVMMPYTFYSQLVVSAPEIRGKWKMAPIPGVQKDGKINNVQTVDGTCTIMPRNARNKEDSFAFMKWWVSEDTQAAFGLDLEMQMGAEIRYATANVEAFKRLPWKNDEKNLLISQWVKASDISNVPGGYYVYRNLTNAFRSVVYSYENPREVLNRYSVVMDGEITRKRIEYELDQ